VHFILQNASAYRYLSYFGSHFRREQINLFELFKIPLLVQFQLALAQHLLLVFVVDVHEQVQFLASVHVIDHTCGVIPRPPIKRKKTNFIN
jgi:hypothetical protein